MSEREYTRVVMDYVCELAAETAIQYRIPMRSLLWDTVLRLSNASLAAREWLTAVAAEEDGEDTARRQAAWVNAREP